MKKLEIICSICCNTKYLDIEYLYNKIKYYCTGCQTETIHRANTVSNSDLCQPRK